MDKVKERLPAILKITRPPLRILALQYLALMSVGPNHFACLAS